MPTLDNYTTGNGYTSAGTLLLPAPVQSVTLIVQNNPIFGQFCLHDPRTGLKPNYDNWSDAERRMILLTWEWDGTRDFNGQRIVGVRVRSAIANKPAIVTIHA